jgi:hypothetical protein
MLSAIGGQLPRSIYARQASVAAHISRNGIAPIQPGIPAGKTGAGLFATSWLADASSVNSLAYVVFIETSHGS